jgi:hypothetical protein
LVERAYRLDPLSFQTVFPYTVHLQAIGRQLDAERAMATYLASGAMPDLFTPFVYLRSGNLDQAEYYIEQAKAVWGADQPMVLIYESMLAGLKGDDATVKSIEQELLQRMESENVMYNFWGTPDTWKQRILLAYQQRQYHLVQHVLDPEPPPQFSDKEWQDLREKMNIAELQSLASRDTPARTRTAAEQDALLAGAFPVGPAVLNNYVGVYEAVEIAYTIEFFTRDGELWNRDHENGYEGQMIALTADQFELLDLKEYHFQFLDRSNLGYDMESKDGQVGIHWRRVDE